MGQWSSCTNEEAEVGGRRGACGRRGPRLHLFPDGLVDLIDLFHHLLGHLVAANLLVDHRRRQRQRPRRARLHRAERLGAGLGAAAAGLQRRQVGDVR